MKNGETYLCVANNAPSSAQAESIVRLGSHSFTPLISTFAGDRWRKVSEGIFTQIWAPGEGFPEEPEFRIRIAVPPSCADDLLRNVVPIIVKAECPFKVIANTALLELVCSKNSAGEVGCDFMTVYPPSEDLFAELSVKLQSAIEEINHFSTSPFLRDSSEPEVDSSHLQKNVSAHYCAREADELELAQRLEQGIVTVVLGQPGAGKSSLVTSGLKPQFDRMGLEPVYLRLQFNAATHPVQQVRDRINRVLTERGIDGPPFGEGQTLWGYFHHQKPDWFAADGKVVTPILIFDQFEDVFAFDGAEGVAGQQVETFWNQFADLVESRVPDTMRQAQRASAGSSIERAGFKVFISLRQDHLPKLLARAGQMPSINRNHVSLRPFDGERIAIPQASQELEGVEKEVLATAPILTQVEETSVPAPTVMPELKDELLPPLSVAVPAAESPASTSTSAIVPTEKPPAALETHVLAEAVELDSSSEHADAPLPEAPAPIAVEENLAAEPSAVLDEETPVPEPMPVVTEDSLAPAPAPVLEEKPITPTPAPVLAKESSASPSTPAVEEKPVAVVPTPLRTKEIPVPAPQPAKKPKLPPTPPALPENKPWPKNPNDPATKRLHLIAYGVGLLLTVILTVMFVMYIEEVQKQQTEVELEEYISNVAAAGNTFKAANKRLTFAETSLALQESNLLALAEKTRKQEEETRNAEAQNLILTGEQTNFQSRILQLNEEKTQAESRLAQWGKLLEDLTNQLVNVNRQKEELSRQKEELKARNEARAVSNKVIMPNLAQNRIPITNAIHVSQEAAAMENLPAKLPSTTNRDKDPSSQRQVNVLLTNGVCLYSDDGIKFQPLQPRGVLSEGAVIKTGPGSWSDLFIRRTGTAVRLAPESEMKINKLSEVFENGVPMMDTLLELRNGRIFTVVRALAPGSTLEISDAAGHSVIEGGGLGCYMITAPGSDSSEKLLLTPLRIVSQKGSSVLAPGQVYSAKDGDALSLIASPWEKTLIQLDELEAETDKAIAGPAVAK